MITSGQGNRATRKNALLFVILLTFATKNIQPVGIKSIQIFAMEPHDKSAIQGDSVVMPCRVVNMVGLLQWTKDDFALGDDRRLSGYNRYKMIGSDKEGDFSLLISQVSLEDDATFQCQVGATFRSKGIRSRKAKLTVLVPPQAPVINEGSYLKTTAGSEIELTCYSNGGRPAAELHWLDDQGYEMKEGIKHSKFLRKDGKTFDSKLKLTFIARQHHHTSTLTCRSENPALKKYLTTKIKLEVRFQPDVRLVVKSGKITESEDVHFECKVKANPDAVTYKWYKNGVPIIGDYTDTYILYSVSRKDHKGTISCKAHNIIGSTASMHVLNVHFHPIILKSETYIVEIEGSSVSLNCPVDSNPRPLITWMHEEKVIAQGPKESLVIGSLDKYKMGKYKCNATVPGFALAFQEYNVFISGPPTIKSENRKVAELGKSIKLECLVHSAPRSVVISWSFNSSLINTYDNPKYHLEVDLLMDGVRNRLVIHKATSQDFGKYNCNVTNKHGSDGLDIYLVEQEIEEKSVIGIISGVIGSVVFIITVSVIVILFLRLKKEKRKENLHVDVKHELPSGCKVQRNEIEPKILNDSYRNSMAREAHELNGYVPYADYSRDYMPPAAPPHIVQANNHQSMNNLRNQLHNSNIDDLFAGPEKVDHPWLNAGYANPYLSNRNSTLMGRNQPVLHTNTLIRSLSPCTTTPTTATVTTSSVTVLPKNQHVIASNDSSTNFDQQSPTTHV